MGAEVVERRSEFRFPLVLPVEYFRPDETGILSYSLDLSRKGTFVSSDDPLGTGCRFGMHLTIPFDRESSRIYRTEATVAWNKLQPFKSKSNGMGVHFVEPLPESLLLKALADNVQKLARQTEAKWQLEQRVNKLESQVDETKRLSALGRSVEKILLEVSNPILALSGRLEIIKARMHGHKKMLEQHEDTDKKEFTNIIKELDQSCRTIGDILKGYKVISELAHIVRDKRETLERKLQKRYRC